MAGDRIILKGMQFYGYHGVNTEEKSLGQPYVVDLSAEMDLSRPGMTDHLADTVSYTHIYRQVQRVVEGESKNLLEAVAGAIARQVLDSFPVESVQVTVKKPLPPVKGSVIEYAAVEIVRRRE